MDDSTDAVATSVQIAGRGFVSGEYWDAVCKRARRTEAAEAEIERLQRIVLNNAALHEATQDERNHHRETLRQLLPEVTLPWDEVTRGLAILQEREPWLFDDGGDDGKG